MDDIVRGSVVFISGDHADPARRVVVVQASAFSSLPSVLVCPLSDVDVDAPLLRVRLKPSDRLPLTEPAWIMTELLTAVPRELIGLVVGHISEEEFRQLNRSIILVLGLA